MEEEIETQDSNLESEEDTNSQNDTEDLGEKLTKTQEYAKNQKIRAEKAEKEVKDLKAKLGENKETETPKKEETKSNEPDYAKLAFLEGKKIDHPEDQKMVMDEAKRLQLPLTDILAMEHIKSKLKDSKNQREALDGAPRGKGKGGGSTTQDVEYYLAKGTTPDDLELAGKVIEARMKKEQRANMFSEELFSG